MIRDSASPLIPPNAVIGPACTCGMRKCVTDILAMLAGGASRAEILGEYFYLADADITAAQGSTDHDLVTLQRVG